MARKPGNDWKSDSWESCESYGSTSSTSSTVDNTLLYADGDGRPYEPRDGIAKDHVTKTALPPGMGNSGSEDSVRVSHQETKGSSLISGMSSGGSEEKPHSLHFSSGYAVTGTERGGAEGGGARGGGAEGGEAGDESEKLHLVDRGHERQLTNREAILHLFKVFTGPSTIGMPAVIKLGGLLFGSVGFLAFGYLTAYGNILVVNCGRLLCKRTKVTSLRYEELAELTILTHSDSPRSRQFATIVRHVTSAMLCLCQCGILAFYIQVIGTIVQSVLQQSDLTYDLPLYATKIFICLALVPYSWMKNLKVLSWFSMIANVSILVCVVTILQYACRHLRPVSELPLVTPDPWTVPLFVSACVFTVEGVPMVLPIENRVKHPEDYGGLCGVITLAATWNIIINLTLGFYGYLCFGNQVPPNVLTAMPNHPWYHVISLLYGMMVFLTFTLQMFLPAEFMVEAVLNKSRTDWLRNHGDILVRTVLVLASYLVTCVVSDIGLIMSLTGALCSVPLLFLFPSLGELMLLHNEAQGIPRRVLVRNLLIFAFGMITFVAGTFTAVVGIVQRLRQ